MVRSVPSSAQHPAGDVAGPLVLLVEDDDLAGNAIEDQLAEIGYPHVVRAATVQEALERIDAARPALVVLDANLRGVPAHAVAERLKLGGIPFIVSTGFDPSRMPGALQDGIVLKKPYDRHALAAALEAARDLTSKDGAEP